VRFYLCNKERWNPEGVNIFGAAARYRQAAVSISHDDARPDNWTLHTGKIYFFRCISADFSSPAAATSRRRGNDLGTTTKYLRKTTSGAAGIGLGITIKYPRRTAGAAAGNGLGTTLKYLRGAAGNGWTHRSSTFGSPRAPPQAAAWALRSSNCAGRGHRPGHHDQVPATHNERRRARGISSGYAATYTAKIGKTPITLANRRVIEP
jgi:hypothetical protein